MEMGLNTDLTHRGKNLHIQTEYVEVDSQADPLEEVHNEIVTHLFLSGQILATQRQAHRRASEDRVELQRRIRSQHQMMLQAVLQGAHDRALILHRSRSQSAITSAIPLARQHLKKRTFSPQGSSGSSS